MPATAADKTVAAKLTALGIKPGRGPGGITSRTLRGWREGVDVARPLVGMLQQSPGDVMSAEDLGWVTAVINADEMVTGKWRCRIRGLAPADARRFVLDALEKNIREMKLGQAASAAQK
jgi:hypothetical protein